MSLFYDILMVNIPWLCQRLICDGIYSYGCSDGFGTKIY